MHGTWRSAAVVAVAATLLGAMSSGHEARAGDGGMRDLYLASRDDIGKVMRRLDEVPASKGGVFVGIVGGMAWLNFVERLEPRDALLVDLNPAQVAYGRCVVELVKGAASRDAFVAAFFSRPFKADEAAFLAQRGDLAMLHRNMTKLEDASLRASCERDLAMIADATYDEATKSLVVQRNKNGRYLQRGGPDSGMPQGYNFLYYGRGWLASEASFARTQAALRAARVRFLASDIGAAPVDGLRGPEVVFWGSNLSTWFDAGREAYERYAVRAHEALFARNEAARLSVVSTYRRTMTTRFVPFELLAKGVHLDASAKVKRHAKGKRVLELIPGKARFGTELRASESVVQRASEPIDRAATFDVAVLHLLNNSGLKWWREDRDKEFAALYGEVLKRAREVVILEHDRASGDFDDKQRARMIGLGDLLRPLFPLLAKERLALDLEHAVGEGDTTRNLVLHIAKK
ncbi:MAG: hypothetical protein KC635_19035 [Myxococcales bacterium]|nr:hypothetical protein [Myxococcales bacterium]MCB9735858.1 hypothetical protein [Deltaproteobacteria bacterium]